MKGKNRYTTNKLIFEYFTSSKIYFEDYCFVTILCKKFGYDFEIQLNELTKQMQSFPFPFIACIEFSIINACGWHLHMITSKKFIPIIAENCDFYIDSPRSDDSFERSLNYLCKEDINECRGENDFSRSSKRYFQKFNVDLFQLIKGKESLEYIKVEKQAECIQPTPNEPLLQLAKLKKWTGTINRGSFFRPFKVFFQQLFIRINKTFFSLKDGYQRENNSISGWGNNSP